MGTTLALVGVLVAIGGIGIWGWVRTSRKLGEIGERARQGEARREAEDIAAQDAPSGSSRALFQRRMRERRRDATGTVSDSSDGDG